MKKIFTFAAIALATTFLASCEKDEGKLPNISFKTGTGYTSADATVGKNDTLLIGINASKSEDEDVLKTFEGVRSYDGGTGISIAGETLDGSKGDSYTKDVPVITRNQAGTEKYTFTVVNKDGLKNSVTLTLTVN
jgi:hypothetical protein